jgi:hypothetical protein
VSSELMHEYGGKGVRSSAQAELHGRHLEGLEQVVMTA